MKVKDIVLIFVCAFLTYYLCTIVIPKKTQQIKPQVKVQESINKEVVEKKVVRLRKKPAQLNLTAEQYNNALKQFNTKMGQCFQYLKNNDSNNSISCINYLHDNYYDYSFYQKNRNALLYNQALILKNLGKYQEAKELLEEIIYYEKNNQELINGAKGLLDSIEGQIQYQKDKQQAMINDAGSYINEITNAKHFKDPSNIYVYIEPHRYKDIAIKAFNTWDSLLGSNINFRYVTSSKDANIICKFIEKFSLEEDKSQKRLGLTLSEYIGDEISNAKIFLVLNNPITKKPVTREILESTALHEIGHALGIAGHSSNKNDIMYVSSDVYNLNRLSNKDINTVLEIYNK